MNPFRAWRAFIATLCDKMRLRRYSYARDARRYRTLRATTTAVRDATGERVACTPDEIDASVDAIIARGGEA